MAIKRLLIANRGEIAVRINRAAKALGIETVQVLSSADRESMAAKLADRSVVIGPGPAPQSYLRADLIVHAAVATGCDAIHPGYGFLSERTDLVEACAREGIVFVGPTADTIAKLGNKISARMIADEAGVPRVPGVNNVPSAEVARREAEHVGYPVLMKAASGGGGRGMFIARTPADITASFDRASAEAKEAFGDGTLYMERYVENARHVEVQVLGDGKGHVVHLGERDCSVQRRYQKIVEEAPCTVMPPAVKRELHRAAVDLVRALDYLSAGTVEFLFDMDREAVYFIEVNTRIQVEHPVTEELTGVDLIGWQLRIAGGEPLGLRQSDIAPKGHAIECRINAEDPMRSFMPQPGRIKDWTSPVGAGIRLDTHCEAGAMIPPYYDSLMAKLIVSGPDRASACERMTEALDRLAIDGPANNLALQRFILRHPDFRSNAFNTRWLEQTALPAFTTA